MNLGELRLALRSRLDDTIVEYLWSDSELNRYLNEATNEACLRARLLVDSTSAAVTPITVTAGVSQYPVHKSVFYIDRVFHTGSKRELQKIGHDELDEKFMKWPDDNGVPTKFLMDMNYYHVPGEDDHTHRLTIYPTPLENSTLQLTVFRLPLEAMESDGDVPELPPHAHADLLHWACHLAYLKRDTDTENLGRAQMYAQLFEQSFGPKPDAYITEYRRKKRAKRVIARWL